MGNKRMVILEVCLFVINVFCATAAAHGGGRPPLPPCPGPCRSRVNGVCVYICECCDDKACYNPDTSGCCNEGTGKTCPIGKECCNGDCCDHSQCEACDGNGHCISGCIASQCEECDGNGHCISRCDSGNCEGCMDGSCGSYCPPGTSCCNGSSCCDSGHPCDGSGGCVYVSFVPWPDQAGPFEIKTFDPNSGVLAIDCRVRVSSGSVGSSDISFDCNSIGDSNMTVGPVTMYNGNYVCIITFTGLPTSNSAFGLKAVKVYYKGILVGTVNIKALFPRDAKNHPGEGSGETPNWYYYWSQTSANFGTHDYNSTRTDCFGYYHAGDDFYYLTRYAYEYNPETRHNGIDTFAETCMHEYLHLWHWWTWVAPGLTDSDGDWVPDSVEVINGTDPYNWDTDGDGDSDEEELCLQEEHYWAKGLADDEDWADPGHQSN